MREIEAPTGFVLSEEVFSVAVDKDSAVIEVEIENTLIRGNVQLTKTDRDYPDNKLTGAEFIVYLADKEGLPESEALSFLKSLDCSKARLPKINPNGLSLKMLKICSPLIEGGTLRPFSVRWPKSAIISNTDFLIHASTAFRKTGNESTLSLIDILEPRVDEKYFLSQRATERLLYS